MKKLIFLLFVALIFYPSCFGKKDNKLTIELPITQVLEQSANYAVIISSHLRLRPEPSVKSKAVTTLWKGYILEILSKSSKQYSVEGATDFWYQINYDGITGWVFGAYIDIYPHLDKALEVIKK